MNKKGFTGIIAVVAIMVVLVGAVVWYYEAHSSLQNSLPAILTGETRAISILGDSNIAHDRVAYPGETGAQLGGFDFEAKSDLRHNSVSVILQNFTVGPDGFYTKNFLQYLTNLQLYNPDTNQVLQTQSGWSANATTITFSNINVSIPSGSTAKLALRADISPSALTIQETRQTDGSVISFMINASSVILSEPDVEVKGGIDSDAVQIMTVDAYNTKVTEQQCVAQAEQNHTNANHCLGF